MAEVVAGITIPDSALCAKATSLVREIESDLLFHHSRRVFVFGALVGQKRKLKFASELLYIGAMFHDLGLTPKYSSKKERFEVDGAHAANILSKQYCKLSMTVSNINRRRHLAMSKLTF